jgi:glycosyltransferase involved in cell wall biosynthesis/tRNA A-37 threonylcarbamoyl transferase component Bud32
VTPDVSVIVPTRDRPAALERCLLALSRQTLGHALETIVVDDGSRPGAVAAVASKFPRVRVIHTHRRNPAAARNVGARAAAGGIICLTDDDCEPAPDWAERLAAVVRDGADASAGLTVVGPNSGSASVASQLIADFLMERSRGQARHLSFAPTNNLACGSALLAELPFDESYPLAAGEDRDWCARLVEAGYALVFEERARVIHATDGQGAFWRRNYNYGRGSQRFRSVHRAVGRREPVGFYSALVREGFRRGPAVGALICIAQLATATGRLREMLSPARSSRTGPPVPGVPGRLLAAGRACDVFEYGDGAVLRRYRPGEPCDTEREAEVMRTAAAGGVPVPEVLEVHPDALVLARVDGPTMLDEIQRKPWRFISFARELGRVHRRVIDAGVVHMDFHPLNIILGPAGPVVIDWSNAGEGDPMADVAFSQVILATSDADFPHWLESAGRAVRRRFVAAYLDGVGERPDAELLAAAADQRLRDPHLRERELESVRDLRRGL